MKNKYKTLTTAITIFCAISLTAVGTLAFFNAKRTFGNNKFKAGTLDLDVSTNTGIAQPISIDNIGGSGKIEGTRTWKVKNSGTLPGKLIVSMSNLVNAENGCNEPEIEAEPNCEKDNIGELGKAIVLEVSGNGSTIASSTLGQDQAANLETQLEAKSVMLNPGEEMAVTTNWHESPQGYGNEVQSDTVNFDLMFRLEQQ